MNGLEYRYKQRFVTERRWYKKPYFDKVVKTLGPQAGFIAFFDNVQGVHIEDDEDNGTVQTYVFDRYVKTPGYIPVRDFSAKYRMQAVVPCAALSAALQGFPQGNEVACHTADGRCQENQERF